MMSNAYVADMLRGVQSFLAGAVCVARGVGVAVHVAYGLLLALAYPAFSGPMRHRVVKHWSRGLLLWLHIGLETRGDYCPVPGRGRLLLANHVSWLDAVVLNAIAPSRFVAKAEVADWPLLGMLCRRAGTLFIRRDIRQDVLRVNGQIAELLGRGECVAIFPEGTTGAEEHPGNFRAALLQGALEREAMIQPVAVRYHDGYGKFNDAAAFVGDMTFIQSLWRVLRSPSLHVTLSYLPPLAQSGYGRQILARQAQGAIHTALSMLSGLHAVHVPGGMQTYPAARQAGCYGSAYSLLLVPVPDKRRRADGRHVIYS